MVSRGPKYRYSLVKFPQHRKFNLSRPRPDFLQFYESWIQMLDSYTSRQLTKAKDKLVAFNGIIAEVSQQSGLTSVAGLWKQLLPVDLLWYRVASPTTVDEVSRKPNVYVAPSWSWAAVNFRVTNAYVQRLYLGKYKRVEIMATIIKSHASTISNGQVSSGMIQISGPMREVSWDVKLNSMITNEWIYDHDGEETNELFAFLVLRVHGTFMAAEIIDGVGLILKAVPTSVQPEQVDEKVFRRVGLFRQRYFGPEDAAIFNGFPGQDSHKSIAITLM